MSRTLIIATLSLLATTVHGVELPEVVTACIEKNSPASGSVQTIELRARDRSGYEQVLQADTYLKRTPGSPARILMHFNEPADIRGARFLIIENSPQNDMYMYMPGLFKVRKITSKRISSSILGNQARSSVPTFPTRIMNGCTACSPTSGPSRQMTHYSGGGPCTSSTATRKPIPVTTA
jgi:hypothetical protein